MTFKEPKSGKSSSITITPSHLRELMKIRKTQKEYKLLSGSTYNDYDLVFAQRSGNPIQPAEVSRDFRKSYQFKRLTKDQIS